MTSSAGKPMSLEQQLKRAHTILQNATARCAVADARRQSAQDVYNRIWVQWLDQLRQREFCVPPLTNTLKGVLWQGSVTKSDLMTTSKRRARGPTPARAVVRLRA